MKKIMSWVIRIGISLGVMVFLYYTVRHEGKMALVSMTTFPRSVLLQAVVLYSLVATLLSLRLHYLFQGQKIYLTKLDCLRLTLIGAFFNNFLPTGAGGDFMKGYLAAKQSQQAMGSIISILMDRIIGLMVLILLASLSGVVLMGGPILLPPLALMISYFLFLLSCVFIALFLIPSWYSRCVHFIVRIPLKKLKPYLMKTFDALDQYRQQKQILLKALFSSFLVQLAFAGVIYVLSKGLGIRLPLFHLLVALPLIHIATLIPSINGLGVREGALVYLLGQTIGMEKALALALLSTGILIFWSLFVGGALYIFFLMKSPRSKLRGLSSPPHPF